MTYKLYEVGGCVRDEIMGVPTKDVDYTVEAPSFDKMRNWLVGQDFEIFVESPKYLTIRARFPKGVTEFAGRDITGLTADFVLARKEGQYTDGRRPDFVEPGTIYDDLARRDFTMNAIAKDAAGNFIDPYHGRFDIGTGVLRCVGSPKDRFTEDALRSLRAIRFMVTKGVVPNAPVWDALTSEWLPPLLVSVSQERKREELTKAFKHDTKLSLSILNQLPEPMFDAIFGDEMWLSPTLGKRKK